MGRNRGGGRARYVLWKGDECIAIGTASELAERLGVAVKTVYQYASPSHKRRSKGNMLFAERL